MTISSVHACEHYRKRSSQNSTPLSRKSEAGKKRASLKPQRQLVPIKGGATMKVHDPPKSSQTMPSPKYQPLAAFFRSLFFCRLDNRAPPARQPRGRTPRVYQLPPKPSRQLRVALDYFNFLKVWDLEALSQLSAPYFTQVTLPASLGVPVRNKKENFQFLYSFRDSLMGAPLEVCSIRTFFLPDMAS